MHYFKNLTDNSKEYDQMAVMNFNHREDFASWRDHPYHQEAVDQLEIIAELIFFD